MRRIRAVSLWRLCGQIGKAATVSSWLLRSLMLLHNRQLTVLVSPPPPPGAINAREAKYQCYRQSLEPAIKGTTGQLDLFKTEHDVETHELLRIANFAKIG